MKRLNEQEEAWAMGLIANGGGSWPLADHPLYDEACVSFLLESLDDVCVFLRKGAQTLREYRFRLAPPAAAALKAPIAHLPGDYEKARRWFRDATLPMPRVPSDLRREFIELEEGVFTTRPIRQSPYDLDRFVNEADADVVDDYLVLAYHGPDSENRMLHYLLRSGPVDLFLQLSWDPAGTETDFEREIIGKCFALADRLLRSAREARREGRLSSKDRLWVVVSDRTGSAWSATGRATGPRSDLKAGKSPLDVLIEVLAWLKARGTVAPDDIPGRRPPEDRP